MMDKSWNCRFVVAFRLTFALSLFCAVVLFENTCALYLTDQDKSDESNKGSVVLTDSRERTLLQTRSVDGNNEVATGNYSQGKRAFDRLEGLDFYRAQQYASANTDSRIRVNVDSKTRRLG